MEQNYISMAIDKHFNCKLIISKEDADRVSELHFFHGVADGYVFDANILPKSNEIILVNEVPFIFPDKSLDKCDSISCEGQIIDFIPNIYSNIFLLTMGTWGCYHEKMKINFEDNSFSYFNVDFKDWIYSPFVNTNWEYDKYDTVNVIICKTIYINNINASGPDASIFFSKHNISTSKLIKSIELPYNPNVFIFSITAEKAVQI